MLTHLLRDPFRLILALLLALSCAGLAGVLMMLAGYNLLIQWLPRWAVLAILALGLLAAAGLSWRYFRRLQLERERRRQAYVHSIAGAAATLLDRVLRFLHLPEKPQHHGGEPD
jgi:membrane protein implicated in regulation of membrane protease activity